MTAFWAMICSNALVAAMLAIGATLLGRIWKNPAAMHVLWLVVLLKLFAPPLFVADLPVVRNWLRPAMSASPPEDLSSDTVNRAVEPDAAVGVTSSGSVGSSGDSRPTLGKTASEVFNHHGWSLLGVFAALWACGAGVMALRYAIQIRQFASCFHHFEPAPPVIRAMVEEMARRLAIKRVPNVLMTSGVLPPLVWSVGVAPHIILPTRLLERLDASAQSTIIAHELVHVSRRDHLTRLLELVATTIFWWHPVVWWASWKLRDLEEQCCDSRVLELDPQHSRTYATALIETLEFLSEQPRLYIPLPTAICSTNTLSRRIRMLRCRSANRLNARTTLLVAALAALPFVVSLAVEPQSKSETGVPILRGRVVDENGWPLAAARVRVAIPATNMRFVNPGSGPKQFETTTGDNGEYRLEIPGISNPATISIDAMKPGYRRLSGTLMRGGDNPRPEIKPGAVTEANLKLPPALYFKGIVVDENGKAIPSVEIGANANTSRSSGGVERTVSNQNGEFELFNYSKEPFALGAEITKGLVYFSHPSYVSNKIDDVYSLAENERSAIRIVLSTGHKLSGIVRDATGNPVPKVVLKASAGGSRRKAVLTDASGKFALRGIAPGATTLSVRALDLLQKTKMPLAVDRDQQDLDVRLQAMVIPPNLKTVSVLGMKLTDLTPDLKTAYDLWDRDGALILDPGANSDRLMIGKLAHGYDFWMVGNKQITSVREFIEQILLEAAAQYADQYSIRVVYSLSSLEFDGTNTQYLKLTKDDVDQLKAVLDQLTPAAK